GCAGPAPGQALLLAWLGTGRVKSGRFAEPQPRRRREPAGPAQRARGEIVEVATHPITISTYRRRRAGGSAAISLWAHPYERASRWTSASRRRPSASSSASTSAGTSSTAFHRVVQS